MRIGYARVSTSDQNLENQISALENAGCENIFSEKVSGSQSERAELRKAIEYARPGDILVVVKIDRLGRSLSHLVSLIDDLKAKEIGFLSLNDPIDTTSPSGQLIFNIFASLAEFELCLIKERTMAGLRSSRERGIKGGRRKILNSDQIKAMKTLYESEEHTVAEICSQFGMSRKTLYNYLKRK